MLLHAIFGSRHDTIFERLFYEPRGQALVSFFFGVAIAIAFQKACTGTNCTWHTSPPAHELAEHTFRFGDRCYRYEPYGVPCDPAPKAQGRV